MENRVEKPLRVAAITVLAALAACSPAGGGDNDPPPTGSIQLQGTIGVAKQQSYPLAASPLAAPAALGIAGINGAIAAASGAGDLGALSSAAPIRGLNAGVLNSYLAAQASEKPLFGLQSQHVLAVDGDGNVLAAGEIGDEGVWSVPVETEVWTDAGTIGLTQGYQYDNGTPGNAGDDYWVCLEPLEYQTPSGELVPALFGAELIATSLGRLANRSVGLFNYHHQSANPVGHIGESDLAPIEDPAFGSDSDGDGIADYLACGSGDYIVGAGVTADFDWWVPASMEEGFLYDYGVAFGLELTDPQTPAFVSVAALDDSDGTMAMQVVKPAGITTVMSLVMTDVGFYDASRFGMPLTPTFALDAAIDPTAPFIELGDAGYDYETLTGGMSYLEGIVFDSTGSPAPGALVIGVLDSGEILAFNLAIADASGSYKLLLPATSEDLAYYIVAITPDALEGGFPEQVPAYSADPDDFRYAIHSVASYDWADVWMVPLD